MRWTPGNRGNVQDARRRRRRRNGHAPGHWRGRHLLVGSWLTGVNLFDVVGGGGATDVVADGLSPRRPKKNGLSISSTP